LEALGIPLDEVVVLQMTEVEVSTLSCPSHEHAWPLCTAFVHELGIHRSEHLILTPETQENVRIGFQPPDALSDALAASDRIVPEVGAETLPRHKNWTLTWIVRERPRAGAGLDVSKLRQRFDGQGIASVVDSRDVREDATLQVRGPGLVEPDVNKQFRHIRILPSGRPLSCPTTLWEWEEVS
jgi:hypothetical protein